MLRSAVKNGSWKTAPRGFSLLEVAIVLTVLGILAASALQVYNLYEKNREISTVRSHIQLIQSALNKYVYRYGRYPAPAPRNAAQGSATFGREVTGGITTVCTDPAALAGDVCVTAGFIGGGSDVYIGDVPFATLGIRYDNILDSWGGRMTYAVTADLTSPLTYSETAGNIEIYDQTQAATIFVSGAPKAHYVIVSSGPDNKAAFSLSGIKMGNCAGAGVDTESCDLDSLFHSNLDLVAGSLTYGKSIYAEPAGATHYDDYMGYANSTAAGIWTKQSASAAGQVSIYNTNPQNIKVGPLASPPVCGVGCADLPLTKLDVDGSVRAEQVSTSRLCRDAAGCTPVTVAVPPAGIFVPQIVGGVPTTPGALDTSSVAGYPRNSNLGGGILCSSYMAMRGIYSSDEVCTSTAKFFSSTALGASCTAGTYATGLNADGTLICN
ncbi:MAG: type II secretion system protein [Pseudobdellovibrionaceae bacterium]